MTDRQEVQLMDEQGFVFLDERNRPYWCRLWGERAWLFSWSKERNNWVSLRPVEQMEIWTFPHNLSEEEQDDYRRRAKP